MKKVLFSVIAILLAIGVVGGGAFAVFSDVETVEVGDISAGTLDLTVGGENPCTEHITISNIAPGWEARFYFELKNTGSLPGKLSVEISEIINKENGRGYPELDAGDITYGGLEGELGANLEVWFFSMLDGTRGVRMVDDVGDPVVNKTILDTLDAKTFYVDVSLHPEYGLATLEPNETQTCKFWLILPNTVGNIIQSDSVEFDFIFHLDQA
ncbi:unnamed protein product [marine sediment metagenome]|uniref:Camelysin metallo-endopeptidase n=1 Tax=marine sediment metagenome TaxID=412755 RepID=X1G1N7_9ZZZZ